MNPKGQAHAPGNSVGVPAAARPGRLTVISAYLYLAMIPLNSLTVPGIGSAGGGVSVAAASGLALVVAWGVDLAVRGWPRAADHRRTWLFTAIVLYVVLVLARVPSSPSVDAALTSARTVLGLALTVPAIGSILSAAGIRPLKVFAGASTILAVNLIVEMATLGDTLDRATAWKLNENQAARLAALGFVACGALVIEDWSFRRSEKLAWATASIVCVAGAMSTGSRTGLVSVVVGAVMLLVRGAITARRRPVALLGGWLAAFAVAVWLLVAFRRYFPERLFGTASALEAGDLNFREVIWTWAWGNREAWLPWGLGPGSSAGYTESIIGVPVVMHNMFLEAAVELGLAGLVLTILLLLAIAQSSRYYMFENFVVSGVVVVLTAGVTGSILYSKEVWVLAGLAAVRSHGKQSSGERRVNGD